MKDASPPYSLRRAGPADAEAVRTLTRRAYAKWVPLIKREPKPMLADYEHAVRAHKIDLLESGGRVLALVEMIPLPDCLLIENLAVDPAHQGRGLGDRLLRHCENLAHESGFSEVRLYTNGAFAANLNFYARRGYVEFAREPLASGSIIVHMRKHLLRQDNLD